MTAQNNIATFICKLEGWRGDARLYRLSPAYDEAVEHVIVSAVVAPYSGPETYIFAAEQRLDKSGQTWEASSYVELPGSLRGGLDHVEALEGLGYVVDAKARRG